MPPYHFSKWREAIQVARDERSIVGVIEEYLATIAPETLETISEETRRVLRPSPSTCKGRPCFFFMKSFGIGGIRRPGAVLHEIAHTFSAASVRVAHLGVEPFGPTGDDHAFRGGVGS